MLFKAPKFQRPYFFLCHIAAMKAKKNSCKNLFFTFINFKSRFKKKKFLKLVCTYFFQEFNFRTLCPNAIQRLDYVLGIDQLFKRKPNNSLFFIWGVKLKNRLYCIKTKKLSILKSFSKQSFQNTILSTQLRLRHLKDGISHQKISKVLVNVI